MFDETRALLVVYKEKDEMILNQLKKLVDTKDDVDGTCVGTEDGTVSIISWEEKLWLQNKKAGNTGDLADKILFIGDIKGTEKLAPIIDLKFEKHGVSYGFAGKQALLKVNPKELSSREKYTNFLKELQSMTDLAIAKQDKKMKPGEKKQWAKLGAVAALLAVSPIVAGIATGTIYKDLYGDAKLVRNQMLIYGITQLYINDLDTYMKS